MAQSGLSSITQLQNQQLAKLTTMLKTELSLEVTERQFWANDISTKEE